MMHSILFIMPAMLNGGAEKVLIDILKNFDYDRYDVSLLLETKDGPYINDIPAQVGLIYLHKKNLWIERLYRYLILFRCRRFAYWMLCGLPLLWHMRGRKFDSIVSFMEGMAVRMHSYIFDKANKNLSWVHIDLQRKHWSLDFFRDAQEEKDCYRKMDKIVFVSQSAKSSFREMFRVDEQKLEVVYNLIDCIEMKKASEAKSVEKTKFTICMVGRLNRQKRYDRALEVMCRLKNDGYDFELWILGSGELEVDLRRMVKDMRLDDLVRFKGFIKPVYPYIEAADVFLNTSESEGYPLTLCEALCLGCPIVATDISGANELVAKSEAGVLVTEDPDSIYEGLKKVMDDEVLRRGFSEKAVAYSKSFDVQETMRRIYDII